MWGLCNGRDIAVGESSTFVGFFWSLCKVRDIAVGESSTSVSCVDVV